MFEKGERSKHGLSDVADIWVTRVMVIARCSYHSMPRSNFCLILRHEIVIPMKVRVLIEACGCGYYKYNLPLLITLTIQGKFTGDDTIQWPC